MKLKFFCILFIAGLFILAKDKSKVLFDGETLLTSCLLDIPLTYKGKDKEIILQKSIDLKDKEIIWLHYSKKTKTVSYSRWYLGAEKGKDGYIYNYLMLAEDYRKGKKTLSFAKYQPKTQRFYLSECFDSTMKKHPEILSQWKGE